MSCSKFFDAFADGSAISIIRHEVKVLSIVFDGVRAIEEALVDHAESEVGLGVAGVFFERGFEVLNGVGEISLADGDKAEIVEGIWVGWINADGGFEHAAGFGEVEGIFAHEAGAGGESCVIGFWSRGSFEGALALFGFNAALFFEGAALKFFLLLAAEALGILAVILFAQGIAVSEDLFELGIVFAEFEEAVEVFDGEIKVLEIFFVDFGDIAVIACALRIGLQGKTVVFKCFLGEVV